MYTLEVAGMTEKDKDTRPFAIVENGEITWQGQGFQLIKFQLICKRHFSKAVWGDHGQIKKRKIDPEYVALRNEGRRIKCLLINIDEAPTNWLDEVRSIYWKDQTFAR